jgi:hypothetical protein
MGAPGRSPLTAAAQATFAFQAGENVAYWDETIQAHRLGRVKAKAGRFRRARRLLLTRSAFRAQVFDSEGVAQDKFEVLVRCSVIAARGSDMQARQVTPDGTTTRTIPADELLKFWVRGVQPLMHSL